MYRNFYTTFCILYNIAYKKIYIGFFKIEFSIVSPLATNSIILSVSILWWSEKNTFPLEIVFIKSLILIWSKIHYPIFRQVASGGPGGPAPSPSPLFPAATNFLKFTFNTPSPRIRFQRFWKCAFFGFSRFFGWVCPHPF